MKYEDVSFNVEIIKRYQTADLFAVAPGYQHLWPKVSVEIRKQRLKELFNLVNKNANSNRLPRSTSKGKHAV